MTIHLPIRAKLNAIAALAALAFALVVTSNALFARRVEVRLASIQDRYLPRIELQARLDRTFDELRRGFQDAVSARDHDALDAVAQTERSLFDQLAGAHQAVGADEEAALRRAVGDYYDAARDVSLRLMADETGEALLGAMAEMQAKQSLVEDALKRATMLDRHELTAAFAGVLEAQREAATYRLGISVSCVVAVVVLISILGRSVIRSMGALSTGLRRFGTGDFGTPIAITTRDELGDLARHANYMAASLDRLDRERKKAEAALKISNQELEAFSYAVAHDLRAPLRGINGFSQALIEDWGDKLDDEAKQSLNRIAAGAGRMGQLIDALLALSRVSRAELQHEAVNLSQVAEGVAKQLRIAEPDRAVRFTLQEGVTAEGDVRLLRAALENLMGNAWKFTSRGANPEITFGETAENGERVYFVKDNGAGFDMAYATKLFAPFQRLHAAREFEGTGIGLATVQRIVHRHGGRIWAQGAVGEGATFKFTLASTGGTST